MSDPTGVQQIYNKTGTGARLGNWVEEEALKTLTGTHRITTVGDKMLSTNARTLAHSERVESRDWKSATHAAHDCGKVAHVHADRPKGARAARLERELEKAAMEEVTRRAPEPPARFETTARETFVRHGDAEYNAEKGRRVMKTLDGRPIDPSARDLDFLASVGVSKRLPKAGASAATMHLTATRGGASASARALADAAPISVYTQQMATGTFNTTAAGEGRNPFLRDSKFTNPVAESEKPHAESRDTPVDWVPGVGKSLAAHAASELSILEVLDRLRLKIAERGGTNGIRTLRRLLARMDSSGDGALDQEEFAAALREMDIDVPMRDVVALVTYFDTDASGKISVEELQRGLAGPMNPRRMALVTEAFTRLDKTGDGVVTLEDLGMAYDTSQHPQVQAGELTEAEALTQFLANFESGEADGRVTEVEFRDYYQGLSAAIPSDDYFELMMRNAWHISGGSGWSENTSNKRVLVRFLDGTEEVIEVKDDLGLRPDDVPAIKARLRKQGVKNFVDVKLYE